LEESYSFQQSLDEGYIAMRTVDSFGNIDVSLNPSDFITLTSPDTPPGWTVDELLSLNDVKESISPRGVSDSQGKIQLVWKDNRRLLGHDEIHYRVRTDTTWSSFIAVSNLDTSHNSPWVAVDGKNNVHVVFLRWFGAPFAYYDVGYRKYSDSLTLWEPEERITLNDSIGLAGRPKVLCDTNNVVYAFWLDDNEVPQRIWYASNNGTGWIAKMAVTDSTDDPRGFYGVGISPDNTIHLVWQDYRSGLPELYHRYYQGSSWTSSDTVTTNGFASVYPRLSADSLNNMHLVYGGGTSLNEKIHYLVWDSFTQTWGSETKFPSQMGVPHVDIAVSPLNSDVHLTFHESISSNIEIMYKHYDAQLNQWEPNVRLTFNYPDIRLDPQITLDPNDYVHLVWWDQRDGTGQEEIYYKTNKVPTGIEETDMIPKGDFRLKVYPNPFHFSTMIRYQIPSTNQVNLSIYNITGRLVQTLVDETQKAGVYQIHWDSRAPESGVRSGIYFYRLKSGDLISTKKLILLR
jgi:hypothetical protein